MNRSEMKEVMKVSFGPARVAAFNDQLAVSDRENHQIHLIDIPSRTHMSSMGGHLSEPTGLTYRKPQNQLLVCDSGHNLVKVLDEGYNTVFSIGDANLDTRHWDQDGKFDFPIGIVCPPDGSMAVLEQLNYRVQIFDAAGRFLRKFGRQGTGEDDLSNPIALDMLDRRFFSGSSLFLIADLFNTRVAAWTMDGKQRVKNIAAKPNERPRAVCSGPDGYIYVSTQERNVYMMDPRKDFAIVLQIESKDQNGFSHPTGLCVDDNNTLIVCNSSRHRLHFFPHPRL